MHRFFVKWASDSAQLTQLEVTLRANCGTCLSRHRFGVMSTPRTRTASTTSIVSFQSLSFSAVLGNRSRLLLLPVHNHSVFSMLSFRGGLLTSNGWLLLHSAQELPERDLPRSFYSWGAADYHQQMHVASHQISQQARLASSRGFSGSGYWMISDKFYHDQPTLPWQRNLKHERQWLSLYSKYRRDACTH